MALRAAAGVSTAPDPRRGCIEAVRDVTNGLDGEAPDVVVVFASGAHLAQPEATLGAIADVLSPGALVGCGAGGVLGRSREAERGTAVAVWAAALRGGTAQPFHATIATEEGSGVLQGVPDLDGSSGIILLADPYSFPTDQVLDGLRGVAPGVPVLGGLASGRTPVGDGALFCGEEVATEGAVGLRLRDVEMLPCVSQGAAPLGREMTVTAAEGNIIHELAGRPAMQAIEEAVGELELDERALIAGGLLLGVVIDSGQPEYEQGDFLVRGVLGSDATSGAIAVGTAAEVGQIVRLHARDARSADADLRRALALRAAASGADAPVGALVFSCNARGRNMFRDDDHDARLVDELLGGAPCAGFFAAGEIGPVGGRSFLHSFTATVAVFPG